MISAAFRFVVGLARIVRYTHRHPVNKALHGVGLLLYVWGASMVIGQFFGWQTNAVVGALVWAGSICIMAAGHAVEGNVRSITPLLVARLLIGALGKKRYSR